MDFVHFIFSRVKQIKLCTFCHSEEFLMHSNIHHNRIKWQNVSPYLSAKWLSNDIAFSEIKKSEEYNLQSKKTFHFVFIFIHSFIHSICLALLTEHNITRNSKSVISLSNSFGLCFSCLNHENVQLVWKWGKNGTECESDECKRIASNMIS